MSRWRLMLLLAAGAGYALLSHWLMLRHAAAPWAVLGLLGPLWLTGLGLAANRFGAVGAGAAALAGLAFGALVWQGRVGDPNRLYMLQHVAINLLMLAWFAGTLRGDGPTLIGQCARMVHGGLTPAMLRYTRRLTQVWSAYFAAMAAASVAVYALRPFADWSLLANVLTPALVAALFIGEHLLRYRLHPEFERASLADAVRAFQRWTPDRPPAAPR